MTKMFGLFFNYYDHYEWHNLVCVSDDARALIERIKGEEEPLLSGDEQKEAYATGMDHYVIEPIERI